MGIILLQSRRDIGDRVDTESLRTAHISGFPGSSVTSTQRVAVAGRSELRN